MIAPGGIGVATEPFGFDPLSTQNHCHVCIASTTPEPPVIPPMRSINDYIKWVHENTNVSMRNISSWYTERASLESIKSIMDPFGKQGRVVIFADITGFIPKGTRIALKCEPLGIESEEMISKDKTFHSASGTGHIYKDFQGFFQCYIYLPEGTTTKLFLNLDYMIERDRSNDVAREYCIHPRLLFDRHGCQANSANYIEMVKVGQCTDIFDVVNGK